MQREFYHQLFPDQHARTARWIHSPYSLNLTIERYNYWLVHQLPVPHAPSHPFFHGIPFPVGGEPAIIHQGLRSVPGLVFVPYPWFTNVNTLRCPSLNALLSWIFGLFYPEGAIPPLSHSTNPSQRRTGSVLLQSLMPDDWITLSGRVLCDLSGVWVDYNSVMGDTLEALCDQNTVPLGNFLPSRPVSFAPSIRGDLYAQHNVFAGNLPMFLLFAWTHSYAELCFKLGCGFA